MQVLDKKQMEQVSGAAAAKANTGGASYMVAAKNPPKKIWGTITFKLLGVSFTY